MIKKIIVLLFSMSVCFGQLQTNKINNTAVIYSSNSTVKLNSSLNMGGFKVTNMLAGTAPLDAVNFTQLNSITNSAIPLNSYTNGTTTVPWLTLTNVTAHIFNLATNTVKLAINNFTDNNASGLTNFPAGIFGNVFTTSNNTFIASKTNMFNGPVVITGTNFLNATNFAYGNVPAGTFQSDNNGTNLYFKGSFKVFPLEDGGNFGYLHPRGVGISIIGKTNDVNNAVQGDLTWISLANTNGPSAAEGRIAVIRASLAGTTANDRGGQLIFQLATNASVGTGPYTKMTLSDRGELIGSTNFGNSPLLTNWNANLLSLNMNSVINMGGFNITNLLAGVNPLDAVNLAQLQGATNGFSGGSGGNAWLQSNQTFTAANTFTGTSTNANLVVTNSVRIIGGAAAAPLFIVANAGSVIKQELSPSSFYSNVTYLSDGSVYTTGTAGGQYQFQGTGVYAPFSENFPSWGISVGLVPLTTSGWGLADSLQSVGLYAYGTGQRNPFFVGQTNGQYFMGVTNTAFTGVTAGRLPQARLGTWSTNVTIDLPSSVVGDAVDTVIGFPGAASNDRVTVCPPAAIAPGVAFLGISSNGNVIVRAAFYKIVDPASGVFKVILDRYP